MNDSRTARRPAIAERSAQRRVVHQFHDRVGEPVGVGGIIENPTACRFNQLGKGSVARLDDRDARRQRFQNVQALRLRVFRRHGQHVDGSQEFGFLR